MLYNITRQALESRSPIKSFLSCLQWDYFSIKNALVLFVFPPHDILMCEITTASPSTGWSGKQSYLGHMPISSRISGLLGCVIDSSRTVCTRSPPWRCLAVVLFCLQLVNSAEEIATVCPHPNTDWFCYCLPGLPVIVVCVSVRVRACVRAGR